MVVKKIIVRKVNKKGKRKIVVRRVQKAGKVEKAINKLASIGSTTFMLNTIRNKPYRFRKSLIDNWLIGAAAPVGQGWATGKPYFMGTLFDPSGVIVSVPYLAGNLNNLVANMPNVPYNGVTEFASFVQVFDQYKINKIKLHIKAIDTDNSLALKSPTIYMRYNYDYNNSTAINYIAAGTAPQNSYIKTVMDMTDVKAHQFTPEHPVIDYTIFPRVQKTQGYVGGAISQQIAKMPWTDVNAPVAVLGFILVGDGLYTGQTLTVDLEYDISFRYSV